MDFNADSNLEQAKTMERKERFTNLVSKPNQREERWRLYVVYDGSNNGSHSGESRTEISRFTKNIAQKH